jgi:hypothetical protein
MFGTYKLWVLTTYETLADHWKLSQIEPPSGVCKGCILGEHRQESFLKELQWFIVTFVDLWPLNILVELNTSLLLLMIFLILLGYLLFNPRWYFWKTHGFHSTWIEDVSKYQEKVNESEISQSENLWAIWHDSFNTRQHTSEHRGVWCKKSSN